MDENTNKKTITWNTAIAGDAPITSYELWRDDLKIAEIPFEPQLTTEPFSFTDNPGDQLDHTYLVKVVDGKGRIVESTPVGIG